jgi:hypothetical protein
LYLANQRSLTGADSYAPCITVAERALNVEIIGDSWVARRGIVEGVRIGLDTVRNLSVTKRGIPGAISKVVYEELVLKTGESAGRGAEERMDVDIAIIIVGVNDLSNSFGADFYSHYITQMVRVYNECDVYPVVVTLPEFGVEETFAGRSFLNRLLKAQFARFVFDKWGGGRISYVTSVQEHLQSTPYEYLLIDFDGFIDSYHAQNQMYENPSHLTIQGGEQFGIFIGQELFTIDLEQFR